MQLYRGRLVLRPACVRPQWSSLGALPGTGDSGWQESKARKNLQDSRGKLPVERNVCRVGASPASLEVVISGR